MPQHLRSGLVACVLLCAALSSVALTLGHSRGVALIGRPLDVGIAVTLDKPGQGADLCPDADVFQGDTRVDASRVTTSLEPGSGQNAVVRVRSSQPVDEPVVTVYLRLGCKEKFTRRYVLLSEEPGDFVAPVAAAAPAVRPAPVAPPAPPAAAAAVARPAERARRSAARAVTSRAAAVPRRQPPQPFPAQRRHARPHPRAGSAAAGDGRPR
jgi:pilus assembly protein FimV